MFRRLLKEGVLAGIAGGAALALVLRLIGEGPIGRYFGALFKNPIDSSAVEGIVEKPYAIPNRRMTFTKLAHPVTIAFWRSVGHSMNDAFYESFLDEIAQGGGQDPFALRQALLKDSPRHLALLAAVAEDGHTPIIKPWPLRPAVADGFTLDEFTVDETAGTVTCPNGLTARITRSRMTILGARCRDCPLRARCTSSARGRKLALHPHDALARAHRARAQDP